MSRSVRVVWDDALTSYDFGPGHPLAPVRVELTMALARELGVLDAGRDDRLRARHRRRAGAGPQARLHRGRQAGLRDAGGPTCPTGSARRTTPPSPGCTRRPR